MKNENPYSQNFFRELQVEFLIHELKDPISVIETGMRTLLEKREKYGELSPRQEKTLKRTLRSTQKAREMLYNLLEIGRSQASCFHCACFQPANAVYGVLTDALEIMAEKIFEPLGGYQEEGEIIKFLSDAGIFLNIAPSLVHKNIFQDETKFRQILGNLIKNALCYRLERIEIRMNQEADHLVIEVSDDGPGIPPEYHEMIFQRYARPKDAESSKLQRKGHGLGLAGALILARCLGGNIELESRKGRGATFRLILPMELKELRIDN
jgi:signal transduction histidine kinase